MSEQRPDRPSRRPGRPGPGNGGTFKFRNGLLGWLLFIGLAVMLVMLVQRSKGTATTIPINEFLDNLRDNKVERMVVEDPEITGTLNEGAKTPSAGTKTVTNFKVIFPETWLRSGGFKEILDASRNKQVRIDAENNNSILQQLIILMIPWLLIFGFIWFFVFRQLRSAGGANMLGNFGKSKARINSKEHTHITFDDVAGVEEAKDEVMEIVEFLKNPKKFQRLGGRIPRGVLLVGEPGTGKTLLAKAIAGEADVPFFSISGSDFVEMFVGVGASRVRDLFKQAKDNSPCI